MPVYVLKLWSRSYLWVFLKHFIPTLGLPEHALPFETPQAALDCLPAVLHHEIEVVNEDCRNADAEEWRLQNKEKKERLLAKSF